MHAYNVRFLVILLSNMILTCEVITENRFSYNEQYVYGVFWYSVISVLAVSEWARSAAKLYI